MNLGTSNLYKIIVVISFMVVMLSSCVSAGLIGGQVAADAAVKAVRGKLAEGEKVADLGNGQYLITVKAPAMSLGERFKAIADETARQNGYKTYDIRSTSVSQGSDSGADLSLLTGVIVCRRPEPKPESQASSPSSVEPKPEAPASPSSSVEPKTELPSSPPSSIEPKPESPSTPQASPPSSNSSSTSAK